MRCRNTPEVAESRGSQFDVVGKPQSIHGWDHTQGAAKSYFDVLDDGRGKMSPSLALGK